MNASELRIGNYYDHNGEIKTATPNTILEVWESKRNWCKPIPLTEEWLLKFGFECYEFNNGQENQYRLNDRLIVIRDCSFYDYGSNVKIDYIHQLQNLIFALTNKELLIK